MIVDLHVHSREGSDGRWPLADIVAEAARRGIGLLAVTDHDSLTAQPRARELAAQQGMSYLTGIELNVTLAHPALNGHKEFRLDFLGYGMDISHPPLVAKLDALQAHRRARAAAIMDNVNAELARHDLPLLTTADLDHIQAHAEGALGRPHIADHLVAKGLVATRQEAFDTYLVRCDVPKLRLDLEEASHLVRAAGGSLVLAHPDDPNGTSLAAIAPSLDDRLAILDRHLAPWIDGIECWHSRHSEQAAGAYLDWTRRRRLLATGGSDCHQHPVLLGSVPVPAWVADQFTQRSAP